MEIKNCPHCGGECDLYYQGGRHGYFCWVECCSCGCKSRSFCLGQSVSDDWFDSVPAQRAATVWNRRPDVERVVSLCRTES